MSYIFVSNKTHFNISYDPLWVEDKNEFDDYDDYDDEEEYDEEYEGNEYRWEGFL